MRCRKEVPQIARSSELALGNEVLCHVIIGGGAANHRINSNAGLYAAGWCATRMLSHGSVSLCPHTVLSCYDGS